MPKVIFLNTMDFIYIRRVEGEFYTTTTQSTMSITLLVWSCVFTLLKNLSFDFITAC